jgi:hypothetical protein
LKLFRDPEKEIVLGAANRNSLAALFGSHPSKRGCAVQKGKRLSRRGRTDGMERPLVRKELPMEFTASVTAVMAIVSFGFLAAILLGMI